MPSYILPTFPSTVNIWTGTSGHAGAPRANVPCQLRAPGKQSSGQDSLHAWVFLWELLTAARTDIRDYSSSTGKDTVEVPAGSGRFYIVEYVDDVAKDFPNEYRIAMLTKLTPWPTPIP